MYLKGAEKIYDFKFSRVNALKKEKSRNKRQEASSLKFNQAEGNLKAIFVTKKRKHKNKKNKKQMRKAPNIMSPAWTGIFYQKKKKKNN